MFKFIKQYAEQMQNADIYPIISLFIFFTFFVVMLLVLVKRMKKRKEWNAYPTSVRPGRTL